MKPNDPRTLVIGQEILSAYASVTDAGIDVTSDEFDQQVEANLAADLIAAVLAHAELAGCADTLEILRVARERFEVWRSQQDH